MLSIVSNRRSYERDAVRIVEPPRESRLVDLYSTATFIDAYAINLSGNASLDIDRMARGAVSNPSTWFRLALKFRDRIMSMFGIKSYQEVGIRLVDRNADVIGFMPVLSRSDDEIIMGERDRHLDFRVSLLVRQRPGLSPEIVATTIVSCHNLLGRAYLKIILPGHRIVMRASLQKAAQAVEG